MLTWSVEEMEVEEMEKQVVEEGIEGEEKAVALEYEEEVMKGSVDGEDTDKEKAGCKERGFEISML